jgi:3-methylfumaryl-CoA hydratase
MWAGSALEFRRPLRVGDTITRASRIMDVIGKEGRTGSLVFVKVRHEVAGPAGVTVIEDQDLVYREPSRPGAAPPPGAPARERAEWTRDVVADEVLLFRYSALTFNGHRIHYDWRYATEVEGYPALVVHGPLAATLLLDLLHRRRPEAQVTRFAFRGLAPLFAHVPFRVCGRPENHGTAVSLWAERQDGTVAMEASATLADGRPGVQEEN